MTKQEKKLLAKAKNSAIQLRLKYMIPIELVRAINNLDDRANEQDIRYLMELSEHYVRVNGYYKRFPHIEKKFNEEIVELLQQGY